MIKGHHRYGKKIGAGLLLVPFLLLSTTAKAQFLDLDLRIDPKMITKVHRQLQFHSLPTNSGRYNIKLESESIGIYSITVLEQQSILLSVDLPLQFKHTDPSVKQKISAKLAARYGYDISKATQSSPIDHKQESILIKKNPNPTPWNTLHLFIYGSLTMSNVPEGHYQNDLTIEIEYL